MVAVAGMKEMTVQIPRASGSSSHGSRAVLQRHAPSPGFSLPSPVTSLAGTDRAVGPLCGFPLCSTRAAWGLELGEVL